MSKEQIAQAANLKLLKKIERKPEETDRNYVDAILIVSRDLLHKQQEELRLERQKGSFADTAKITKEVQKPFELLELLKYAYSEKLPSCLSEVEMLQNQIATDFNLNVTDVKKQVLEKLEKPKTRDAKDGLYGYAHGHSIPTEEKTKLSASAPNLSASTSKPPMPLPRKNKSSERSSSTVSSPLLQGATPSTPLRSSPPTPPQRNGSTLTPPALPPRPGSEPQEEHLYDEIRTDGKHDLRKGMKPSENRQTKSPENPNTLMHGGTQVERPVPTPRHK